MLILNQQLVAKYALQHPDVRIEVEGGGSETGISALLAGQTDIAAASRAMKESELAAFEQHTGSRPQEIAIALDGLAIYLHDYNPIRSLSVQQVAKIMTGEVRNWREVGGYDIPIQVYGRDSHSGTRTFLEEHVMDNRPFAPGTREYATTPRLVARVSTDPGGIGYGGIAYAKGAHIIHLAQKPGEVGVWPTPENVATGKYPVSRPLFYYVNPASNRPELLAYIDWVLSPEGQEIVSDVGFIPSEGVGHLASKAAVAPELPAEFALSPGNLKDFGFQLSLTVEPQAPDGGAGRDLVTLRFDPTGATILKIRSLSLRIGEDAEVPVTLGRDLAAQFSLRSALIATSSLILAEAGAPLDGSIYTLRLADFFPSG